MKKNKIFALTILALIFCFAVILAGCQDETKAAPREFTDQLPIVEPDPNTHVTFTVDEEGFNVYAPYEGKGGYRYGPSIMYYPDGSVDAWFASKGISGEWDWFTYKHSDDGGKTWSDEKVMLQPTGGSYDQNSVCDPGVIYFNGYYYIGYTSTAEDVGLNNIFVARSENPDGPFEKWNGKGWGGNPAPIIYFDEYDTYWGAGEPSFVVLEDTLYIYYTWICPEGDLMMVATADATSENWPATMEVQGVAHKRLGNFREDSCDVVYIEDLGKFVAFSTYERFTEDSGICVLESNDGIHFTQTDIIRTGTMQNLHNIGIAKRSDGHIQLDDEICFVGYAYGEGRSWAKWATRFQNITIKYYEGDIKQTDVNGKGIPADEYFLTVPENLKTIGITTKGVDRSVNICEEFQSTIKLFTVSEIMKLKELEDIKNVKITGYDSSIISVKGLEITAISPGTTHLLIQYKDFYTTVTVNVYDDVLYEISNTIIESFTPINENITIELNPSDGFTHIKQIRGYVVFRNHSWGEAFNRPASEFPNKSSPKVPREKFEMTFEVADPEIVSVDSRGRVFPKALGTTKVTVTITGGLSFTVTVNVI
ncbi:MAG: hypothetical protein E7385_06515 [Ruminococcaceae bacterium]|nr:hypothetical protein [Oscillospiraceae bacterium]